MKFIIAIAITALIGLSPLLAHASTGAAPKTTITKVVAATNNGISGHILTIKLDGKDVQMFAPIRPFVSGNNLPLVGAVIAFKDQSCFFGFCGGYATITQKSTTVEAYRP